MTRQDKEQAVTQMLNRVGVKFKEVLVLGSYIHIACHSEKAALHAATFFPASHYTCKVFSHLVPTLKGKKKYGVEWKCVAIVKP